MTWNLNPAQAGIKHWIHVQTSQSVLWLIEHNMGSEPIVEVLAYDGGVLKKAYPKSVVHVSPNITRIEWTSARSGQATFISP